jgi:NAD(P)-dependent dehydrogenase (short-subunit alcohol dehydrogenase family)/acyl carrier protein
VITGGLGGLGLGLAAWLVRQGARHLALIGRTPLPPREEWNSIDERTRVGRRVAAVERLEAMGARVRVGCADVGNEDSLAACLADLSQDGWPEVRGVIHAAGVMSYQSFREATVHDFRDTLHAKAIGGWLIHKWAARKRLDCFVLFSSAVSIVNSPFVGGYAVANAFLDGLAHRREGQGLAALSINWGLWAAEGMAEELSPREFEILEARGMSSIPADLGFEVLGLLAQQKNPQLGVIPVDWEKWKRGSPGLARTPIFDRLIHTTPTDKLAGEPDMRAAISAASGAERSRLVREAVRKNIVTVLGLLESDLDEGMSMSRLGLDSIMATELRNRLVADTGCSLPLVRLLEGPSVAELAVLLEAELKAAVPSAATEALAEAPGSVRTSGTIQPREAGRVLDGLDGLSDDQVDALLKEMLGQQETTS